MPIGVYPSARLRCSSRITSWPASPAPTITTSFPRATSPPTDGRSKIVLAASRAPATSARVRRKSRTKTERGRRIPCTGEAKYTVRPATTEATLAPSTTRHMSRVDT